MDELSRDELPNPLDQLRHDLKTPLTTIHGRAPLLVRGVQRSSSLAAEERTRMRDALTTVEDTVRDMVTLIDDSTGTDGNGEADSR